MAEYIKLLVLMYFSEKGNNYDISELGELLGCTTQQLGDLIDTLKEENKLEYYNYELRITEKGIVSLIGNNLYEQDKFEAQSNSKSIIKTKKLEIGDIYVPKNFLTKL